MIICCKDREFCRWTYGYDEYYYVELVSNEIPGENHRRMNPNGLKCKLTIKAAGSITTQLKDMVKYREKDVHLQNTNSNRK